MTYIFESGLAHHIEGLIQQKRADGYAYHAEEKLLKRFDTFCVQNYPELTTVTYEMAAKWSEARPCEGDAYHNRRMSVVKVLGEYILSLGQEAYIPNFFCKAYRPAFYIPSKDEVKELLRKMDIRTSHNPEQLVLQRTFYKCGLSMRQICLAIPSDMITHDLFHIRDNICYDPMHQSHNHRHCQWD